MHVHVSLVALATSLPHLLRSPTRSLTHSISYLPRAHVFCGRSRFPLAALLLSSTCTQSLHLHLDQRCIRRARWLKQRQQQQPLQQPQQPPQLESRQHTRAAGTPTASTSSSVLSPFHASTLTFETALPLLPQTHAGRVSRHALRCMGVGDAYSARHLQLADGTLVMHDGFLDNF